MYKIWPIMMVLSKNMSLLLEWWFLKKNSHMTKIHFFTCENLCRSLDILHFRLKTQLKSEKRVLFQLYLFTNHRLILTNLFNSYRCQSHRSYFLEAWSIKLRLVYMFSQVKKWILVLGLIFLLTIIPFQATRDFHSNPV